MGRELILIFRKRLITEVIDPQLSLPFGEPEPKKDIGISAFLSDDKFQQLPSRYQKAIAQAVTLFYFLQNKEDVSFASVFTPLLGPMDEAARGFILRNMLNAVPAEHVDNNGLMPIGLLCWLLDCAKSTRRKVRSVFEAVRIQFVDVSQTDLVSVIDSIYNFRNEYIAFQDRELSDIDLAGQSLKEWANGLYGIWSLY